MSASRIGTRPAARRRPPQPPPLIDGGGDAPGLVLLGMAAFLAAIAAGSLYNPRFLPLFLAAGALLCLAVPVLRFPVTASVAWLLIAATTPEMWLGEFIGQENLLIAGVKLAGLALVAVCMLRYGARFDLFNPGFAFIVIFVMGLAHGLWPTMTLMDSVRSLLGSAAPFAFSFSRLSRRWCNALIGATVWVPSFIIGFGLVLAVPGIRPLFTGLDGVMRLAGPTHPAFLGGFAATGVYAALVELYRDGRNRNVVALVINFVILALSGARAPLACSLGVTAFAFFALRAEVFPARRRLPLIMLGALALPVLVAFASGSSAIRLLNVLSSDANNLSGRDLIWPEFRHAWDLSPMFGWGIGAAKSVIDPDSLLAKLLGTTAAHNEYLRVGVEGGYVGETLLLVTLALWVTRWTRGMRRTDRFIMRAVFIAFAVHSRTDNTLIAGTASIMFAWVSAVFARAALEREAAQGAAASVVSAHADQEAAQIA